MLPTVITDALKMSDVDTYNILPVSGSDDNYSFSYVKGKLIINKAFLTVTADDKTIKYGDPLPVLTYKITGFRGSDSESDLDYTVGAICSYPVIRYVGLIPIYISGGIDNNYDFIRIQGKLIVNQADLMVKADDRVKDYGKSIPSLSYTLSGFVFGENKSVIDSLPKMSTTIKDTTSAGFYPESIWAYGGSDTNYKFIYLKGNFTVNAVAAKIQTDSISIITDNSATCYAHSVSSGGVKVIQKGVCWGKSVSPTLNDSVNFNGPGMAVFQSQINNLQPNTIYFVRSFIINSIDTTYGNELTFKTMLNSSNEIKPDDIKIYPNPVNDVLFVEIPKSLINCHTFEIYDQFGRKLISGVCENQKTLIINTEQLSKGVYLVRIKGEKSYLGRFVKI